jgi:hypothetical protein
VGTCPARIAGGGVKFYGIYLHLASSRDLRIANGSEDPVVATRNDHTVHLHNDRSCTVTGEQHHQGVLGHHAPKGDGTKDVVASLAFCRIKSGKYAGEEAIEILIGGRRVGQLTYAMSQRYGQIVKDLSAEGVQVTCDAYTVNTPKGVQVELLMPHHGS